MNGKSNGGYVIVDASPLDVGITAAQTIPGLHEKLKTAISSKKLIVVVGMVNRSLSLSPTAVTAVESSLGISVVASGASLFVSTSDEVGPLD